MQRQRDLGGFEIEDKRPAQFSREYTQLFGVSPARDSPRILQLQAFA